MSENRVCKHCLMREMAEADAAMIEKYKAAIKASDRVNETTYESRLTVCKTCDKLDSGTCFSCGCYVELRALAINGKCPMNKW